MVATWFLSEEHPWIKPLVVAKRFSNKHPSIEMPNNRKVLFEQPTLDYNF